MNANITQAQVGNMVELTYVKPDNTVRSARGTVDKTNHGGCIVLNEGTTDTPKFRSFDHNRIGEFRIVS